MNGPSIFNKNKSNPEVEVVNNQPTLSSTAINLGKIFGYMTLAILLTGIASIGFAFLIGYVFSSNNEIARTTLLVFTFIAFIVMIVCSFLAGALSFAKSVNPKSRAVAIPFALYAICFGYLFGFIVLVVPWEVLAISFGVTAVVFGTLSLIGLFTKSNLNPLLWVSMGLLFGALLMTGLNFLMMLFFPEISIMFLWIITFVIFAAIMLSTIWDVWNIKQIASAYINTPNVTLYCAFRLYCDFIVLFIRILYFVLIIFSRRD